MKVLFFRPTLGQGGADRVTATLLRHLDRKRFEVHVALLRATGEFLSEIPADVLVHDLGVRSLARCVPALTSIVKRERPDVLFSTSSAANLPAILAHELSGRRSRCVISERNALLRGHATLKRRVEVALKKILYKRADTVTAVSAGVAEELHRVVRVPRERLRVVYNPVLTGDIDGLARVEAEHAWFSEDVPIILGVGRLVPQKDFKSLIAAFARVRSQRQARLFMLGDGPLRESLQQQANSLGVSRDVHFAGFDKNPFRYMARCAIYVQTSRAEGLPGSLIQAMRCGAAPIATDCQHGPAEIISRPGEDGFLVPVGSVDALVEQLNWLLDRPAKRAEIGQRARQSVERFTLQRSLALYSEAILGNALSRRGLHAAGGGFD